MFGISDAGLFLTQQKKSLEDVLSYPEWRRIRFLWKMNDKFVTRPFVSSTVEYRERLQNGIFDKHFIFTTSGVRIFLSPLEIVNEVIRLYYGSTVVDVQFTPTSFRVGSTSASWTWTGGLICLERDGNRNYKLYDEVGNLQASINNNTYVDSLILFYQLLGIYSTVVIIDSQDSTLEEDYELIRKIMEV
jgi:hypothetical protein